MAYCWCNLNVAIHMELFAVSQWTLKNVKLIWNLHVAIHVEGEQIEMEGLCLTPYLLWLTRVSPDTWRRSTLENSRLSASAIVPPLGVNIDMKILYTSGIG